MLCLEKSQRVLAYMFYAWDEAIAEYLHLCFVL